MSLLSRYLLREHGQPFLYGLGVILFVLLTNFVVDSLDLFLAKGVPAASILEVFVLSLGWMVAVAAPMAVLVATLMAFGRLSGDQEILAMRAAGASPRRLTRPIFGAALVVTLAMIAYHEWVLPASNHRLANLLYEIHRRQPTLGLEEGVFLNTFPGYSILAEHVDDRQRSLSRVTIYETLSEGGARTIRAARGHASWSADGSVLTLDLRDGEIHETRPSDPRGYGRVVFEHLTLQLARPVEERRAGAGRRRGDREMSVRMMRGEVRSLRQEIDAAGARARDLVARNLEGLRSAAVPGAADPLARQRELLRAVRGEAATASAQSRRIARLEVEIQKKFAIPAACLIFVLVGAPLGIRSHRGGLAVGIGMSVVFFVAHYLFLLGGEELADRGYISPIVGMWGGDLIVGVFGLWAFARTERDLPFFPALPGPVVRALSAGVRWSPGRSRPG